MKTIGIYCILCVFVLFIGCTKEDLSEELTQTSQQNESSSLLKLGGGEEVESEPNNNQSQADGPIGYGNFIAGTINNSSDVDFCMINSENGHPMTFYLDGTDYHVAFQIINTSGNIVQSGNYRQVVVFTPQYTGTYYVKIYGYSGINYVFTISSNELAESEPNNTMHQGDGPITPGFVFTGVISGDDDWVYLSLSATRAITFFIKGSSTYVSAAIYNQSNQLLVQAEENEAVTLHSVPAGNYKVKIFGYNGTSYTFHYDPLFTVVNPIYFNPTIIVVDDEIYKYVCSASSFMSYPTEALNNWANYFPGNAVYYNLSDYYEMAEIGVLNLYPNGFPQLRTDWPTQMKK